MPDQAVVAVIDDDESVRCAVASLLRSCGMAVATYASAEQFLRSPHQSEAGCLIVDLQMPGMGGLALQDTLNAQGRRLPIIFITAHPDPLVRDRALAAGAVGFMGKPFAAQALIRCTEHALQLGRQPRPSPPQPGDGPPSP